MIYVCPDCGQNLSRPLKDGICICNHCNSLFDSSKQSKLLSVAWIARKKDYSVKELSSKFGLTENEAIMIYDKIKLKISAIQSSYHICRNAK